MGGNVDSGDAWKNLEIFIHTHYLFNTFLVLIHIHYLFNTFLVNIVEKIS